MVLKIRQDVSTDHRQAGHLHGPQDQTRCKYKSPTYTVLMIKTDEHITWVCMYYTGLIHILPGSVYVLYWADTHITWVCVCIILG